MKRAASFVAVASLVTACAASKSRDAQAPAAQEAAPSPATGAGASQAPAEPAAQQPGYAPAPAPPPPSPATMPGGAAGAPVSREVAIEQAKDEIARAQRDLEFSRGDCVNVCRALGSMDRATGKLCSLTADAERDRCDDAKRRLVGARDRVRRTCGSCPDGQPAVEHDAPIPSMR